MESSPAKRHKKTCTLMTRENGDIGVRKENQKYEIASVGDKGINNELKFFHIRGSVKNNVKNFSYV